MDEQLRRANKEAMRSGQFNGLIGMSMVVVDANTGVRTYDTVDYDGMIVSNPFCDQYGTYVVILWPNGQLSGLNIKNCRVVG